MRHAVVLAQVVEGLGDAAEHDHPVQEHKARPFAANELQCQQKQHAKRKAQEGHHEGRKGRGGGLDEYAAEAEYQRLEQQVDVTHARSLTIGQNNSWSPPRGAAPAGVH